MQQIAEDRNVLVITRLGIYFKEVYKAPWTYKNHRRNTLREGIFDWINYRSLDCVK